jgi:Domain of unknown function (DUF4145)
MAIGDGQRLGLIFDAHLDLDRCPHCNVANPALELKHQFDAAPARANLMAQRGIGYVWHIYMCRTCAGLVSAAAVRTDPRSMYGQSGNRIPLLWIIPAPKYLDKNLPSRVAHYLGQAQESVASPSASIVMSASAIDAMLKEKGLKDGSLFTRINKAAETGIITKDMAHVAHDVRLGANDERHADEDTALTTDEDARRCLEFAEAIAEMIFILPTRVKALTPKPAKPG